MIASSLEDFVDTRPLDSIRNRISTGKISEAVKLVEQVSTTNDPEELLHIELQLERSRLYFYLGQYSECIEICQELLQNQDVPLTSRLTMLQVLATAYLETGQLPAAIHTIELGLHLRHTLPYHPCLWSLNLLKTRIENLGFEISGLDALDVQFKRLFSPMDYVSVDHLHSLMRIVCEGQRVRYNISLGAAKLCYRLSVALGNSQFEQLDRLHLYLAAGIRRISELKSCFSVQDLESNQRLRMAFDKDSVSQLGQQLRNLEDRGTDEAALSNIGELAKKVLNDSQKLMGAIFPEAGVYLSINDRLLQAHPITQRVCQGLIALSDGETSEFDFFASVWGLSDYDKDKRGGALRMLLTRIKQQTKIQIKRTCKGLNLPRHVVVIHS